MPVANVAVHEAVTRVAREVGEVVEIAGVRQPIVDDDVRLGILVEQIVNEVGADESGAARHEEGSTHLPRTMNRLRAS